MAITIGSSTITGLAAGGLPSGTVTSTSIGADSLEHTDFSLSLFSRGTTLTSGVVLLPGGYIIQCGKQAITSGVTTITFPIRFANECLFAAPTTATNNDTGGIGFGAAIRSSITQDGVSFSNQATTGLSYVHWMAIGY